MEDARTWTCSPRSAIRAQAVERRACAKEQMGVWLDLVRGHAEGEADACVVRPVGRKLGQRDTGGRPPSPFDKYRTKTAPSRSSPPMSKDAGKMTSLELPSRSPTTATLLPRPRSATPWPPSPRWWRRGQDRAVALVTCLPDAVHAQPQAHEQRRDSQRGSVCDRRVARRRLQSPMGPPCPVRTRSSADREPVRCTSRTLRGRGDVGLLTWWRFSRTGPPKLGAGRSSPVSPADAGECYVWHNLDNLGVVVDAGVHRLHRQPGAPMASSAILRDVRRARPAPSSHPDRRSRWTRLRAGRGPCRRGRGRLEVEYWGETRPRPV